MRRQYGARQGITRKIAAVIFAAALESSKLRGVLALQLFDPSGGLRQALPDLGPVAPESRWWRTPPESPEARFHEAHDGPDFILAVITMRP